MININDTLISSDLLESKFCCDLESCKGACCVKGTSGAPLNEEEIELIPKIINKIKPYLRKECIEIIEKVGTHVIDEENEAVTPLNNGQECAYVVFDGQIAKCGIEKAYFAGSIRFRKPVSCHLYPIRIRKYNQFIAVNYDRWDICDPARVHGEKIDLSVFEFVKEALIRRFDKEWYKNLKVAAKQILNRDK
jgi:Protein of unknown function (DUF3109)